MAYLPAMVPRGASGLGCGCGMGDVAASGQSDTGVKQLQVQLGRFMGPSVPAAIRLRDTKIAVTGSLDAATAIFAATIMMRRAAEALAAGRGGNADVNQAAIALSDPVGYVGKNIPGVVEAVQLYADSKGLAGASMPADLKAALGDPKTMAILGGIALGVYLFTRRR